jgi:hypothetical protein
MQAAEGHAATAREEWLAARERLHQAYAALSEEVRAYPSPIARCDDQLPKLLERRAAVHREMLRADAQSPTQLDDGGYRALAARYLELLEQVGS